MRGALESEVETEATHAAVAVAGRRAVRVRGVLRRQVVEVVRDAHVVARLDGRVDEVREALRGSRVCIMLKWLRAHLESAASRPVPVVLDLRRLPVALFHERDAELLREARTDAVPRHLKPGTVSATCTCLRAYLACYTAQVNGGKIHLSYQSNELNRHRAELVAKCELREAGMS